MSNADDFLAENSGSPSFKFAEVGDKVVGTLTRPPAKVDGTDFNGDPQTSYVFEVQTDEGDTWRVWAPIGRQIARAIAKAMNECGAKEFKAGDRLAVEYHADGEPSKPGFNPPKLFKAAYKPAVASVPVDDLL